MKKTLFIKIIYLIVLPFLFWQCKSNNNDILYLFKKALKKEEQLIGSPAYYDYLAEKERLLIINHLLKSLDRQSYKELIINILNNEDSTYWKKVLKNLEIDENFFNEYRNPVTIVNKKLILKEKPDCDILQLSYMNDILIHNEIKPTIIDMWTVTNFKDKYSRLNLTYIILVAIKKNAN